MDIRQVPIKEIKPYAKNAKKHDATQIENVRKSIEKFGIVQPLVIDKDKTLVIGHCRFEACKKLGYKELPCVQVDKLTDEEVAMLRLLDNKLNESDWDVDLLAEELENLDFGEFDIDWGINDTSYIDELLNDNDCMSLMNNGDRDTFNITFVFDNKYKDMMETYIKKQGKNQITKCIIDFISEGA